MKVGVRKRIILFMKLHDGEFTSQEVHDWLKCSGIKWFPTVHEIGGFLSKMPEVRRIGTSLWISAGVAE